MVLISKKTIELIQMLAAFVAFDKKKTQVCDDILNISYSKSSKLQSHDQRP